MVPATDEKARFSVEIHEEESSYICSVAPTGNLMSGVAPNGAPKRVPQLVVVVRREAGQLTFDWAADDPGPAREELEADIATRLRERGIWISRVKSLVDQVEQWAKEIGWATRRLDKKLEDSRIGTHRVPALLMQEDIFRVLLEPVGRSSPGSEGLADLYLLPAYDDIASLYYYEDNWHLHYLFAGAEMVASIRDTQSISLSKESMQLVLAEMRKHAA